MHPIPTKGSNWRGLEQGPATPAVNGMLAHQTALIRPAATGQLSPLPDRRAAPEARQRQTLDRPSALPH